MNLETQLKLYLQDKPHGRERRNKVRCVANVLQRNHPTIRLIPPDLMCEIVSEVIALERYWRKILLENEELRGSDYSTKRQVVQEFQQKIGYEGGANVKLKIN